MQHTQTLGTNGKTSLNFQFIQLTRNPFFENKIPVSYKEKSEQLVVVTKTCFVLQTCYYSNGLDDNHFSFSGNPSQYFSSHIFYRMIKNIFWRLHILIKG